MHCVNYFWLQVRPEGRLEALKAVNKLLTDISCSSSSGLTSLAQLATTATKAILMEMQFLYFEEIALGFPAKFRCATILNFGKIYQ